MASWETREALRDALQARTGRPWRHGLAGHIVCGALSVAVCTLAQKMRMDIWFPLCPTDTGWRDARMTTLETPTCNAQADFGHLAFCIDGRIRQEYGKLEAEHRRVARQYDSLAGDPYQATETQ